MITLLVSASLSLAACGGGGDLGDPSASEAALPVTGATLDAASAVPVTAECADCDGGQVWQSDRAQALSAVAGDDTLTLVTPVANVPVADAINASDEVVELPTIDVVVDSAPRQVFRGFGTSQPRDDRALLMKLPAAQRDTMLDLVYRDLGGNALRLWVRTLEVDSLANMKASFYAHYLDSGLLSEIQRRGRKLLLLAPGRGEIAPTESMAAYAARLAQFIADVRRERGVEIDASGVANEPAGFTPAQLAELVGLFRSELDQRGLSRVKIIAPEWSSPDGHMGRVIDAMKADPKAWDATHGIGGHSYNMGLNPTIAGKFIGTTKEYWQTEAGKQTLGRGTDEQPGNALEASTAAARFLNDLNFGATHWFWFIGAHNYDPHPFGDGGQELVRPDNATGGVKISTKYFYLKQLLSTFDYGAVIRSASSSHSGPKAWGYGRKPVMTAAAAINPDGTWAVGLSNTTGIAATKIAQYDPSSAYRVRVQLPQRVNGQFKVLRSNATKFLEVESDVRATEGLLQINVAPNELVTLRQASKS